MKVNMQGPWVPIECAILTGRHHAIIPLSKLARLIYYHLLGYFGELRKTTLTRKWGHWLEEFGSLNIYRDSAKYWNAVQELHLKNAKSLVITSKISNPSTVGRPSVDEMVEVTVVGLELKWYEKEREIESKNKSVPEHKEPAPPKAKESQEVKTKTARTRKLTPTENAFVSGFTDRYGHAPFIGRPQAIALNQAVQRLGPELVAAKIAAWWTSPAGDWVKGQRTIGPFLKSLDDIDITGGRTHVRETPTERIAREAREAEMVDAQRVDAT